MCVFDDIVEMKLISVALRLSFQYRHYVVITELNSQLHIS